MKELSVRAILAVGITASTVAVGAFVPAHASGGNSCTATSVKTVTKCSYRAEGDAAYVYATAQHWKVTASGVTLTGGGPRDRAYSMRTTVGETVHVEVTTGRINVSDAMNSPTRSLGYSATSIAPNQPSRIYYWTTHDGRFRYYFAAQRFRFVVNGKTITESTYAAAAVSAHRRHG
jgi:hypothetical protein